MLLLSGSPNRTGFVGWPDYARPMRSHAVTGATARSVFVTGGTGTGNHRLTAFDAALQAAGIHEANLIRISSVTPASAETKHPTPTELAERIEAGAYHPTVYAQSTSNTPGERVHAAVAGARLEAGHGINVEHHGVNADEAEVRDACANMIEEMAARRGSTIDGTTWVRYETCTVPDDGAWSGAVAAILYA